jgi:hypothetical protein
MLPSAPIDEEHPTVLEDSYAAFKWRIRPRQKVSDEEAGSTSVVCGSTT